MTLIMDIIVVAVIKALIQRDRPSYSDIHPLNLGKKILTGSFKLFSQLILSFQTRQYFRSLAVTLQEQH